MVLNQVKTVLVSDIKKQCIGQWLPFDTTPTNLALSYLIDKEEFTIASHGTATSVITTEEQSLIELVVFSDLSIESFAELLTQCHITLKSLTAINQRNNLTSYRFQVAVNNLVTSRQLLSAFNLTQQVESCLTENAPKLSQPGLLVMDMDSTAIKIECIDEIAALAGVGEEVAAVTALAMQGELDFKESLYQRVEKLSMAPESILANVAKTLPLMEGLETLVKELKKHQWRIAIASGGFTYFADHLKTTLKLDAAFANVLEIKEEKLTGKVLGEVVDAQAKASCLHKLRTKFEIPSQQTVAMGDGANDLVMMSAAQLGVAHHAKPVVLAQADTCITKSGLDCLLHWLS